MDYNYHFIGMHLIWWAVWFLIVISFFYFIRKEEKSTPLDILQKRFSAGKISVYEYEQRKRFLEKDQDLKMRMFILYGPSKHRMPVSDHLVQRKYFNEKIASLN